MNYKRAHQRKQLSNLATFRKTSGQSLPEINLKKKFYSSSELNPTLVKAGYLTLREQKRFIWRRNLLLALLFLIVEIICSILNVGILKSVYAVGLATYLYFLFLNLWIKHCQKMCVRQVYYETPLFLEELVLLVGSGLALFPAMQEICSTRTNNVQSPRLVLRYIERVYHLAAGGLPVSEAFKEVASACPFVPVKHTLLHLEVSANIGGELIFALQSLASQVNSEWKFAVETRVKKLENMVVFPVFTGVMGMMLLIAAVPIVPIMNFMDSIKVSNESRLNEKDKTFLTNEGEMLK